MGNPASLRFRARGTALVPNFEYEAAGVRAFIGRKKVEVQPGQLGFAPLDEAVETPYRQEYVKACKDGDLWAADEATAKACGVKFDPAFGVKSEKKAAEK
jgi:hypothetical protein